MGSLKKFVVPSQNLPSENSEYSSDLEIQPMKFEDAFLDHIDQNNESSELENGKVLDTTETLECKIEPTQNKISNGLPKATKMQTHWTNKKFIEKGMIFCLTCGNFYRELHELSIHIEKEPKCKTKANLSFLSTYMKNNQTVKVENNENGVFQSSTDATEEFETFENDLQDPLAV